MASMCMTHGTDLHVRHMDPTWQLDNSLSCVVARDRTSNLLDTQWAIVNFVLK